MATSKMFYTFTWKIENISLYKKEMDIELSSPPFKIGTTNPTEFQIYFNPGDWSKKNIYVRVLDLVENLSKDQSYESELTLLSTDGEVIESHSTYICLWSQYSCFLQNCLYLKPTLFSNEKVLSLFLPQNSLIIRCKISDIGSGECFFHTVLQQKVIRWSIRDFTKSSTFTKSFQVSSLYLTIDLCKLECYPSKKIIMIKFLSSNQDMLHFGTCALMAVGVDAEKTVWRYGKVDILPTKYIPPLYSDDMEESMLDKKIPTSSWEAPVMLDICESRLIKSDCLTLQCEFTFGIGEIWNGNQLQPITLQNDLLCFYRDKKLCDATLKTGTSSFPVHKTVLGARSSVFCAMFESDTEEGRTGIIHIPDIESETLEEMLYFMYTDSLRDISWERAAGLYSAADKYHIQTLKNKCVSVLMEKLSVSNACDALVLADTYQEEHLMQAAKDLVFYRDEVINSAQWKEMEKKNPQLAIRFLRKMYFKKKK